MPKPSRGTECCKLLLSKASKDMQDPLIPMAIPALSAYLTDVKFMYCDNKYYELCGQMGHLIGPSGIGKAQLNRLIEAIMRQFRSHDEGEYKKLVDWQRLIKTKGANKEKPERPEVGFWFPPADLTNPAFIQNAMALESMGHRTQYLNLPEVEMAAGQRGSPSKCTPITMPPVRLSFCDSKSCCPPSSICNCHRGARTSATIICNAEERRPAMDDFIIRAYTKKELALMYFPYSEPHTAVKHLMSWIRRCNTLSDKLAVMGYKSLNKGFTPREVKVIIDELGPP